MAGEDGASWVCAAQLSAPLKVALPLEAWGGAAADGGLMNGLMLLLAGGVLCWGVAEAGMGKGWGCVAEPKTLATICEGVMPTTGTLAWGKGSPLAMG